ncbi:MAG: hypothetical protein ACE5HC_08925 [Candidatus Binatia bacterium]
MGEVDTFSQMLFIRYAIPGWQMGLYILIISFCMLTYRHKLSLMATYLFTLYWGFNLYWGQFIAVLGHVPTAGTLYLLFGLVHVVLTLVAFFQEE